MVLTIPPFQSDYQIPTHSHHASFQLIQHLLPFPPFHQILVEEVAADLVEEAPVIVANTVQPVKPAEIPVLAEATPATNPPVALAMPPQTLH